MRILLLTQVLPYPPDSGPKIKTLNVIKYLAARHDVTLASFVRKEPESHARELRRWCRAVHTVPMERGIHREAAPLLRSLVRGEPLLMLRDQRATMHRLVERLARETPFDAVHADQLNMAQYALRIDSGCRVLDAHNSLWLLCERLARTHRPGPRRWFLEREARLLRAYEGRVGRACHAVLAVSQEDAAALAEVIGSPARLHVVPISVDTSELKLLERRHDPNRIVHVGTLLWPPNADGVAWFVRSVLPLVRTERPRLRFDVVGTAPPRSLRKLQDDGVLCTGYVDDPTPYLENAGVFVAPLRAGSGMRVKILTALAHGLAVVSTSTGCEGIEVTSGRHLLIADSAEDFASATLKVLADPDLADGLGRAGRLLVEERYDYRSACRGLDRVYASPD